MSTALAIAGVTAVLRDMLDAWLTDQDANSALNGGNAEVTALAPDTIALTGAEAAPQLNLFLHQVSPNPGWRNADLPSRDQRGERVTRPPLALDLHYLLTAYGPKELQAEVLLGYGMQLLHEVPVLARDEIEDRLPPPLLGSHLGSQVELIKVTPDPMTTDGLSRLWSALEAHYRPTAAYRASVVLIEAEPEGRAALPVLTRGPVIPATNEEEGIVATPSLEPGLPGISAVRPPNAQPAAVLGDTVEVEGHHLDGTNRAVMLESGPLGIEREVPAVAGSQSGLVRFIVPQLPAALAVGTYMLRVLVQRPGETERRESNRLALTIAPHITTQLPASVTVDANGTGALTLNFRPRRRPHQSTSIIVGRREVPADPDPADPPAPTGTATFTIPDAPLGTHLLRLRIDGVDSLLLNRTVTPPAFLDRRVVIA
jgi:Pvc16 N-terminal domain